jgi:hypothetical protein
MRKPFRVIRFPINSNCVILAMGSNRYNLDLLTRDTELERTPAEVIPIDKGSKSRPRKPKRG